MSTRALILDAFEEILIASGERAATLDAVAAAADVSKGGLLYHFKSKEALVDGVVARLGELVEADLAAMAAAPEGPAAYYVGTSAFMGSPLDRSLIAAARLVQDSNPTARQAMQQAQHGWYRLILEEVGNAAIARAIVLLGDGLYYNAALAGDVTHTDSTESLADDIPALLSVVEILKGQARTGK